MIVYKNHYIEHDKELSKPKWCVTHVYQYISFLKDDVGCDWDFFDSLSDAKTYVDINTFNH